MENSEQTTAQENENNSIDIQKRRKNYTKQGILIFIGSIFFILLMAVPFCLDLSTGGSPEIIFTFRKLEIFGDGSILGSPATDIFPTGVGWDILGFLAVFNFEAIGTNYTILEGLSRATSYLLLAYLFICVFDFFFSFFLIATKNEGLRKFCKVISVISGILLLILFLLMLLSEVGYAIRLVKLFTGGTFSGGATEYVFFALKTGALFYIIGTLFTFISCVKHFSWYHSAEYDY